MKGTSDGSLVVSYQRFAGICKSFGGVHQSLLFRVMGASDSQDAVDAIRPEHTELALIVTAEIDEAAPARTGAS